MIKKTGLIVLFAAIGVAGAAAQLPIELETGFLPDPFIIEEELLLDAPIMVDPGLFSLESFETGDAYEYYTTFEGPTYLFDYQGGLGGHSLHFSIASSWDLLIGVYAPDGNWYRNDDAIFLNPAVSVPDAPPGLYEVVVYGFEPATVDVMLGVSEVEQFYQMEEVGAPADREYREHRPEVAYVTFAEVY